MHVRTALALQATRRTITTTPASRSTSSFVRRISPGLTNQFTPLQQRIQARYFSASTALSTPSPIEVPMAAQTDTQAQEVASQENLQIDADHLSKKLQQSIKITHISVEDMSGGCGQAFNAIIVSPEFEKKTLLARSRLVNGVLKEEIAAIHAWTPRCLTPEQWEKEKERIGG